MSNSIDMLNFNKLVNWFLNDTEVTKDLFVNNLLINNICFNFKNLKIKNVKNLNKREIKVNYFSPKKILKNDKDLISIFIKLITEIKKNKQYFHDFLIHGSFATGDYVKGWSDLDTYVIIKNEILLDELKLKNLKKFILNIKKYLYKIDPIQHHGFIFCPQIYFQNYQSFLLPTNVLQKSKSVIKSNKIIIHENINNDFPINHLKDLNNLLNQSYKTGILKHHKYNNRYLKDNYLDMNTMYQMKYFLSIVMTLPTYYLHSIGKPIYKKDSFNLIKENFLNEWEIIEIASKIRSEWVKKERYPFKGNKIPLWLKNMLGDHYFERAYILSKKLTNK